VQRLLEADAWELYLDDQAVRFMIDGEDPGEQLRSEPVRERVSDVAAIPEVRARVVEWLRSTTSFGPLVMEGRDIGSVVFPDAKYKYYIDADPEERARRRHEELVRVEAGQSVETVKDSLTRRDTKDRRRATAPLQIALGSIVIDSTHLSVDQVVDRIVRDVLAGSILA
jgi:cytidylate kinase